MAQWTASDFDHCKKIKNVTFNTSDALRNEYAYDFGHFKQGKPLAIAACHSETALTELIQFANTRELSLTPRGLGLSQAGQSLGIETVSLDLSALNQVSALNESEQTITVSCGATWRDVVKSTLKYGYLPRQIPLNLNLTVGGVLSIGGLGANSHCEGTIIQQVTQLKVITGDGEYRVCDPHQEKNLFDGVLAGLGRIAVMHQATLNVRKVKSQVRTFYLTYDDHETWLADQKQLMETQRVDYMESFCSPALQGLREQIGGRGPFALWLYPLQIGVEFEPGDEPKTARVLEGLRFWRHVHTEDLPINAHTERYEPRFAMMRQTGGWQQKHPWLECFLSYDAMKGLLPRVMEQLPLSLGGAYRIFYVDTAQVPAYFMLPEARPVVGLGILPTGVPEAAARPICEALSQLNQDVLALGGKRYLSGWFEAFGPQERAQHYGSKYAEWQALKEQYDPRGVFRSCFLNG